MTLFFFSLHSAFGQKDPKALSRMNVPTVSQAPLPTSEMLPPLG